MARHYGRGVEEFFAEEFHPEESLFALFRAEAGFAEAQEVAEAVSLCIALARQLANLEDLLGIDRSSLRAPAYADPVLNSKWQGVEQGRARPRSGVASTWARCLSAILKTSYRAKGF